MQNGDFSSLSNLSRTQDEATSRLREYVRDNIVSDSVSDEERIIAYELYWQFYHGNHWRQYNRTMMSFNYVRAFVDKVSQFLLGNKPFTFNVRTYESESVETEIEAAAEAFFLSQWNRNKRHLLAYEMLQMGSIMGDLWLIPGWVTTEKYVKITVADSRHCYPAFLNGDVNTLEKFLLRQPLVENDKKYRVRITEYWPDKIVTYFQKTTSVKTPEKEQYEKTTIPNPLGFIPVVHVKNRPHSSGYFSLSDVEDVLKLNKTYNELAQEIKGVIDYYVAPTTVVTGATVGNLTKKLGRVWSGLPAEASVFNLGLDVDLSAAQNFMAMLKTAMHEMSDVPENFLGKIQAISNTSAAALQLTFQPIIQQADLKWMMYGQGIVELNTMIAKMVRVYDPKNALLSALDKAIGKGVVFEDTYQVEPVFNYGFPQDRSLQLQQAEQELRLRLNSRRRVLNSLGVNNVQELLKEIQEDAIQQAELDREVADIVQPKQDTTVPPAGNGNAASSEASAPLTTPKDFMPGG